MDTYSVADTAKVLSLSQKRIRQLLAEGKLKAFSRNPIRIEQAEVIAFKEAREKAGLGKSYTASPSRQIAPEVQALIDTLNENTQRALTALEQASEIKETALREQLANLQAERDELRLEVEAMRTRKRGLFRR